VIKGIIFFEKKKFVKDRFEGESLVVVIIIVEEIMFFEKRKFVKDRFKDKLLVIIMVMIEEIIFFERNKFVRDRSKNKLLILIIIIIIIEKIVFTVFNLENIRDLIISIIINLTNSIISLFIIFGKYEN
jgi:hypothetical protein